MDRPYTISRTFGIWDSALDPTRESTYQFLDQFLGEMTALFPDEYLHLGGDETTGEDWQSNPRIAAYMRDHHIGSPEQLQVYFSSRALALAQKHHRQMVGWDEILQPDTPKDAVIQSWRGAESLAVAGQPWHPLRPVLPGRDEDGRADVRRRPSRRS
jgi:hexosaminidase